MNEKDEMDYLALLLEALAGAIDLSIIYNNNLLFDWNDKKSNRCDKFEWITFKTIIWLLQLIDNNNRYVGFITFMSHVAAKKFMIDT